MKTYAIMNMLTGELVKQPSNPYVDWVDVNYGLLFRIANARNCKLGDATAFKVIEV